MPNKDQRFKTFKEWATWMVTLWFESDEILQSYWQQRIKEIGEEAKDEKPQSWSQQEYVQFTLADDLKEWVKDWTEAVDFSRVPVGILQEYIEAGVEETDWVTVAINLIGE